MPIIGIVFGILATLFVLTSDMRTWETVEVDADQAVAVGDDPDRRDIIDDEGYQIPVGFAILGAMLPFCVALGGAVGIAALICPSGRRGWARIRALAGVAFGIFLAVLIDWPVLFLMHQ